ncbi:MAG: CCA tRNA nucleotidyltransferase [Coriobacteriales bacterium]
MTSAPARYNGTMNEIEVPHKAQRIIDLLEAAGFEAFVVGGCVRDAIMGRTPNDWDITTSARPAQIERVMADAGLVTLTTGAKYGTVTVRVDHESFETTTFRADGSYSDGRHPDSVELLERVDGDLARRDFTVNAMAYNPKTGIVDLHGGQEDLSRRVLRSVGDPHTRFDEDALRILRGMRFASVLGFAIESETAAAMHADRHLLDRVSAERIWAELAKLLCGPDAVRILREYRDVIAVLIPELEPEFGFDQHNPFHAFDVWEHTLHALAAAKPDAPAPMRLGLLLHDIGKPHCLTIDENGRGHMYGHEKVGAPIARGVCKRLKL